MILLIKTNLDPLHDLEFVKPIENVLEVNHKKFTSKHYSKITKKDLNQSDKVIITGTSLKDNEFLNHLEKFEWIKDFKKPVLGICAGMQIISLVFGGKLNKKTEIGYYFEFFDKKFLSLEGEHEVYHLHNNYTSLPKDFEKFNEGRIAQAIKHNNKEIYGVLFHPEVRNIKLIESFIED